MNQGAWENIKNILGLGATVATKKHEQAQATPWGHSLLSDVGKVGWGAAAGAGKVSSYIGGGAYTPPRTGTVNLGTLPGTIFDMMKDSFGIKQQTTPAGPLDEARYFGSAGGSGGAPSSTGVKPQELYSLSGDEIARKYGIRHDYDEILGEYQSVVDAKMSDADRQFQKLQGQLSRDTHTSYDQYMSDMRQAVQNAAATGASKGMRSAEAITAMLGHGERQSDIAQFGIDMTSELVHQRGVAMEEAQVEARRVHTQIAQHLASIGVQIDANQINKYIGELGAQAQIEAARLQAAGMSRAASVGAEAQNQFLLRMLHLESQGDPIAKAYVDMAYRTTTSNIDAQTQQILDAIRNK